MNLCAIPSAAAARGNAPNAAAAARSACACLGGRAQAAARSSRRRARLARTSPRATAARPAAGTGSQRRRRATRPSLRPGRLSLSAPRLGRRRCACGATCRQTAASGAHVPFPPCSARPGPSARTLIGSSPRLYRYTLAACTGCESVNSPLEPNGCGALGMDMVVPRSRAHFGAIITFIENQLGVDAGTYLRALPGVYTTVPQPGLPACAADGEFNSCAPAAAAAACVRRVHTERARVAGQGDLQPGAGLARDGRRRVVGVGPEPAAAAAVPAGRPAVGVGRRLVERAGAGPVGLHRRRAPVSGGRCCRCGQHPCGRA